MNHSIKNELDLPIGFSMALAQNGPAMMAFAGLDEVARQDMLSRARSARSKAEMHDLVSSLTIETHNRAGGAT